MPAQTLSGALTLGAPDPERHRSLRMWVEESPLGPLAVTVGEAGVRSVALGAEADDRATPDPAVAGALRAYFDGDLCAFDGLSVDLEGRTPFCRRVLAALRQVGPGEVVSYGALSAEIGRPGAARAVGRAVGSNPLPIVVPCHRVVAGDGSLGGYSGGLDVKRWLLAHEGHEPRPEAHTGWGSSTPRRRK